MTDNTAHNIKVIEEVAKELNVDHIPKTLLCKVHPLMTFRGKIKELCQDIHNSLETRNSQNVFLYILILKMKRLLSNH